MTQYREMEQETYSSGAPALMGGVDHAYSELLRLNTFLSSFAMTRPGEEVVDTAIRLIHEYQEAEGLENFMAFRPNQDGGKMRNEMTAQDCDREERRDAAAQDRQDRREAEEEQAMRHEPRGEADTEVEIRRTPVIWVDAREKEMFMRAIDYLCEAENALIGVVSFNEWRERINELIVDMQKALDE